MDRSSIADLLEQLKGLLLTKQAIGWIAAASIAMFVASIVLIPAIIAALPADYFKVNRDQPDTSGSSYYFLLAIQIFKNLLGILLLLIGILLLFLPGQGLLTILVAIILLDFPGKRRFERTIIRRPPILKSANWLREKAGKPALKLDED